MYVQNNQNFELQLLYIMSHIIYYITEDCKDNDSSCGANPGLPEMTCKMPGFEFVKIKCPKLCHMCGECLETASYYIFTEFSVL